MIQEQCDRCRKEISPRHPLFKSSASCKAGRRICPTSWSSLALDQSWVAAHGGKEQGEKQWQAELLVAIRTSEPQTRRVGSPGGLDRLTCSPRGHFSVGFVDACLAPCPVII